MRVALVAICLLGLAASSAAATDRDVTTTGTDTGDCSSSACATIAYAVGQAVSGDRIVIGAGTFVQTNAIRPIAKSLDFVGAGPGNTVISGGDANNFATAGVFRLQYDGTTTSISDLTISHLPSVNSGSAGRFGIYLQPTLPSPATIAYSADLEVDNVTFVGNTGAPAKSENAVYAAQNRGTVTITNSIVQDVIGNSLLFENQMGPASVTDSVISKPLSSTGAVIFDMLHANAANTQAYDQTGVHSFTGNTITASSGIAILAGWPYTSGFGPSAFPVGVTISGNSIDTDTGTGSAISLLNATAANDGAPGAIDNLEISGNTMAGSGSGTALSLTGGIPDPQITGNSIRGRTTGISLRRFTQTISPFATFDHHPTGTVAAGNQIVDNDTGVMTDSGISVDATLNGNWWGCNTGPSVGGSPTPGPCDTVETADSSAITLDDWIVLRITATPDSALASDGAAAVTAGFDQLNTGAAAPSAFADGTFMPFSAAGGSVSPLAPGLVSAVASTTFTSSASVGRSASATFDHQTVTHDWDNDTTPPVVTITSPADGTETTDPEIDVFFTVTDFGGGVTCDLADGDPVALDFGVNTITVSCTDGGGNTGTDSVNVTRLDIDPPTVTITAPANGTITANSSVTLHYTVSDDTATDCNLADGAVVPLNPGANSITVICTDAFGNVGFDSVSVIRDNNPPVVTIVSPLDGAITNQPSLPVNYSVTDDYGSVSCDLVDGAPFALSEGPNTITVSCTDTAGNVGSDSVNVTRDSIPPSLTITAPLDGSSTTDPTATLNFLVSDATTVTCAPQDGDAIALSFGPNTISVTCTDAAGNTSTESVTVTRTSTVPPVVTITSPAPGAIVTDSSVTLTYAAASQDGTVSCDPPSGSSVPLAIGTNTLTVNCVDSFGNAASASVTVYRPDALPACARDIVITSVYRTGSATRIRGTARLQFAGQRVSIQYQPSGNRIIARPKIAADGSFAVSVKRRSKPSYSSNKARYRAIFGSTTTSWIKLTRRMGSTFVSYAGNGRLQINGSVGLPLAKGQPLRVERSDACGNYRQIGWLKVQNNGNFGGTVASGGASSTAVFIRLKVRVAKASDPRYRFYTYSIVQPVVVDR